MAAQIPHLLESCLSLPPETSQIVLTGILGASTNWLVLRYLHSLLKPGATNNRSQYGDESNPKQEDVRVVLVSWMRDYAFWKDGAGRLGLNLGALTTQRKFSFVDGLSHLFTSAAGRAHPAAQAQGHAYLESLRMADVAKSLSAAVDQLCAQGGKIVLVLDQPDVWLATAGTGNGVTSGNLRDLILDLREKVHATILTVSADEPLISSQTTSLEKEHAAFGLSLAHEAEAVLSLRLLDTGTAKDVSGVVRITRGGGGLGRAIEEREYLYHVGGDGGVKVFERGQ
ncbi:hypothetical protein N0V93_009122 [Gnomoniopsis smithogilvyi]|uniref:Elongator complex protein 6 n=1 Tax=Gnomoniopsis smithogilvyi TaxID=1191159 RepID=A0A9W8YK54_9PEZI|nr:hypothetical protein N0V93_009122 [Gnomoniopsis smithogilvyi]